MAIQIISPRQRVERVSYSLFYPSLTTPGAGWGPTCDEHGNILGNEYATAEQREQQRAEIIASGEYGEPRIQTFRHSYIEDAVGRCHCGCEVVLYDPLNNECEGCGRWFNLYGQEKINPHGELARALDAEGSW